MLAESHGANGDGPAVDGSPLHTNRRSVILVFRSVPQPRFILNVVPGFVWTFSYWPVRERTGDGVVMAHHGDYKS